mgnify:CR=1 FL=1
MKINSLISTTALINSPQSVNSNLVDINKIFKKRKSKYYSKKRSLNKSKLPLPSVFYSQLGIELKGNGTWKMAKCPFHQDTKPSMSINTIHGGFICHACGQSGDMLSFYMNFKQVDFISACNLLELWEK